MVKQIEKPNVQDGAGNLILGWHFERSVRAITKGSRQLTPALIYLLQGWFRHIFNIENNTGRTMATLLVPLKCHNKFLGIRNFLMRIIPRFIKENIPLILYYDEMGLYEWLPNTITRRVLFEEYIVFLIYILHMLQPIWSFFANIHNFLLFNQFMWFLHCLFFVEVWFLQYSSFLFNKFKCFHFLKFVVYKIIRTYTRYLINRCIYWTM